MSKSAHLLFMEHGQACIDAHEPLSVLKGFWSRQLPEVKDDSQAADYPCAVAYLMTPIDEGQPVYDEPGADEYTSMIYIIEAHSDQSAEEADALNEELFQAFNESRGVYEDGRIDACVKRVLMPDTIDKRRAGRPIYRIGYRYEVLTYRVI